MGASGSRLAGVRSDVGAAVREAGSFGVRWLQLVGLLHCIQEYGVDFSTTVGSSMVPVFNASGDVLLFERLSQRIVGWSRGEVIVAISPKDPDARICKRILGLPGDRMPVGGAGCPGAPGSEVIIPRGHVWLQGDNRAASHDSRHYGPVPMGLLQGKVRLKLWPPHELGLVRRAEASSLNAAHGAGVPREGLPGPAAAQRHRAALLAGAAFMMAALGAAAVAAGVAPKPPRRSSAAGELIDRGPLAKEETKDECAACSGEFSSSGVIADPRLLGGAMTFEDVQKALHANCPEHCGRRRHRRAEESPERATEAYLEELANASFKCSTAKRGEMCYDLVEWTVTKVLEDPDFHAGVSAAASPEQVQLQLHRDRPGICPLPCLEGLPHQEELAGVGGSKPPEEEEECHTAEKDEDCFSAILWVLKEGIFTHPKWYLGLNTASTLEEVQEHVHRYPGDHGGKCPMPCKDVSCRDAVEGEPCFGAVEWALDRGIANHSDWFKGLSVNSTFAEVQMNLYLNPNATVSCPRPCSYCHTAVPGERCHSAVAWVLEEGIVKHPECYKGLNRYSSFQEVQHHLWKNRSEKSARCQKPCAVVEPDGISAVV